MFSNHNFISQSVSKSKISELVIPNQKQAYLEKQLQIESLERDREATLHLLNEAQKQTHSPKPANERSQLLEEARRRQKERALLSDIKPSQQTWDGWEDQEPVCINKEKDSQSSSKLAPKKDAEDFKQFIDKEYLQLKQELENLRKSSKPPEGVKSVNSSRYEKNIEEVPVKNTEKVAKVVPSVRKTVEKPKVQVKPQPFIEVRFKEKPTRESEEVFVEKKSSFKVESSSIEIIPENRKSPLLLTKREVEKKSEKGNSLANSLSGSKNSSGRASSVNANEKPADVRTQRATWAETPQPTFNWDQRYANYQPFNYPYYQYPPAPAPGYGYNMPYGPAGFPPTYAAGYPPPNYHQNYAPMYYQPPAEFHFSQQVQNNPLTEKPPANYQESEEENEILKEEFEELEEIQQKPLKSEKRQITENKSIMPKKPEKNSKETRGVIESNELLFDFEEVVKPSQAIPKKLPKNRESFEIQDSENQPSPFPEKTQKNPEKKPEQFFITFSPTSPENKIPEQTDNKKPVLIEIGVKNTKSLADNFREKNNSLAARIHKREDKLPKQDHKEKTKEELIEIRKNFVKVAPKPETKSSLIEIRLEEKKNSKEPSSELMERLATGQRARVSKEEMLKLNKKNYQQLPEVKRRQEEEKKKQEKQLRLLKAKEYEKIRQDKTRFKYVMDN